MWSRVSFGKLQEREILLCYHIGLLNLCLNLRWFSAFALLHVHLQNAILEFNGAQSLNGSHFVGLFTCNILSSGPPILKRNGVPPINPRRGKCSSINAQNHTPGLLVINFPPKQPLSKRSNPAARITSRPDRAHLPDFIMSTQ